MSKKAAAKSASAKSAKPVAAKAATRKTLSPERPEAMSMAKRAAAVEENLGESQSLRDFLSGVGWR
jgi:hypothetical protein